MRHPVPRATAALVLAALSGSSGCVHVPDQSGFTEPGEVEGPIVQLSAARIPHIEGIAVHCWFAGNDAPGERWHRWEVWQSAGSEHGHLRVNNSGPIAGVGAGPSWAVAEWRGDEALRLLAALSRPGDYPYRDEYAYWPGPNSNTYITWVLREADIDFAPPRAAVGSGYPLP